MNKIDFIQTSNDIHNNKYDYSKVDYKNKTTKVTIRCPEHGEFEQKPHRHLISGCRKCSLHSSSNKLSTDEFINRAKKTHGNQYDYSQVNYKNWTNKVSIICRKHGVFKQRADRHLYGNGCPKCHGSKAYTTESFTLKSKQIHGDKYNYSKVDYKNIHEKVIIICPEHGEFKQQPAQHINGQGCKQCGIASMSAKLTSNMR